MSASDVVQFQELMARVAALEARVFELQEEIAQMRPKDVMPDLYPAGQPARRPGRPAA